MPEDLAKAIAGWDVSSSRGDLFDDNHQLSKLTGHPATPLCEVVADTLKGVSKA
ncbi:hypothetical protein [Ilyomonas limi]|uniref:hypothetical protein n=1 Tax=Ilyomonas limi TaxID=2575867 RepID=UPI00148583F5|nr:hypothetical protein [Ilyomonas limi]